MTEQTKVEYVSSEPMPHTVAAIHVGDLTNGERVVPVHALYVDEDCKGPAVGLSFGVLGSPEVFPVTLSFLSSLVVELSGETVQ